MVFIGFISVFGEDAAFLNCGPMAWHETCYLGFGERSQLLGLVGCFHSMTSGHLDHKVHATFAPNRNVSRLQVTMNSLSCLPKWEIDFNCEILAHTFYVLHRTPSFDLKKRERRSIAT